MTAPVEPKVQAAGITAAVSGAALYLLQRYVFKGTVPDGVASMVYIAVPGILAAAAGWLAPHQNRPAPPKATGVEWTPEQVQEFKDALAKATATTSGTVTVLPPEPPAVQPPAAQP